MDFNAEDKTDIDGTYPKGSQSIYVLDDTIRETRVFMKNVLAMISGFPDFNVLHLAKWTTATRPAINKEGLFGYNETTKKFERHNGTNVVSLALDVEEANHADTATLADTATAIATPEKNSIISSIYPVGSIYMSVLPTSPATLFGGTWVQIKDTFLLSCGDEYVNGETGGEATHTLIIDELPSHKHTINLQQLNSSGDSGYGKLSTGNSSAEGTIPNIDSEATGGGQAHNNMPPYLVVYMWKRTA